MARKKNSRRYNQLNKPSKSLPGENDDIGIGSVQRGHDERGKPYLRVSWIASSAHKYQSSVEVSEWLDYVNIAEPMAWALLAVGKKLRPSSRYRASRDLTSGFFCYLRESRIAEDTTLREITNEVINGFIGWLSQMEANKPKYTLTSRRHRLGVVRRTIAALRRTKWANQIAPKLRVRTNPWPGRSRIVKPVEVLSRPDWEALYRSCTQELIETMEDIRKGWAAIGSETEKLPLEPKSRSAYKELGLCLAATAKVLGDKPLSREELLHRNASLAYAIDTYHGGIGKISKYWYPSPRLLVPFVIYIAVHTIYNTDTLLGLEQNEVIGVSVLGIRRIKFSPNKGRSKRTQPRSFPAGDPLSLDVFIRFLEEWTAYIRPWVDERFVDRVFIFVPLARGPKNDVESSRARGFLTVGGDISVDVTWRENLKRFCVEHGLPYIRLSEIRKTGQDVLHDLFNGDLRAIQAASGHRDPQTYLDHYQSDAARKRNDERLAEVMSARDRWVGTSGIIDPRREPYKSDLGAATPGFICFDPFDSPIPDQIQNRLCRAYGACPACPLASVDRNSAYALTRLAQLKRKIEEAQHLIEAPRWLWVWAPRLKKLNEYWLPQFTDDAVIQQATSLSLNPLPDLE